MNKSPQMIVGVDVGGTFTDAFFLDEEQGRFAVAKVPSTPADQSIGFLDSIRQQASDFANLSTIVHGTTVGTNALLQRDGEKTGIITTAGFRDVLEMRRRDRPTTWGLWGQFEPIVPRDLRLEVRERIRADGSVHEPLDEQDLRLAIEQLLNQDVQAVALVFINAYANPVHEKQALELLRELWPNEHIIASHQILPEIREFERTSTTTLNAFLQPTVSRYLSHLQSSLNKGGFTGEVLIVQSNGGVMTVELARQFPVKTALSGPAAGVIASAWIAETAGFPNVITCDMGGTSFDVSLVAGGGSTLAAETAIDFGLVIRSPMIEMTTIGAGGGSIAWVDRGGLLRIGPESAGSNPGPVCYGLGNERPTVTDANLVLARIDADNPIGGKLKRLDVEASRRAIVNHVGNKLELDVMAAAEAIIDIANSKMAGAIRLVSVERGHDPKRFSAMPFGGGGGLHAGALMREVGLASAIIPRFPGVNSALGCCIADMRHDFVQTINRELQQLNIEDLNQRLSVLAAEADRLLDGAAVRFSGRSFRFALDMAYLGQTHTVAVDLQTDYEQGRTTISRESILEDFERTYRSTYGRLLAGISVRVTNLRVAGIGHRQRFDLKLLAPQTAGTVDQALVSQRVIWYQGEWHQTPVYERLQLPVAGRVIGPALLQQPDTTIWIEPGQQGRVDEFGNFIITNTEQD